HPPLPEKRNPTAMSRIPLHTVHDAPENSRQALASLALPNGKVFNIFGHMAASPAVLHGFLALKSTVTQHATLDTRTQEAIALVVGHENDCDYCQAAHTATARQSGLTTEQILAIRSGDASFDPKLDALLNVVREAVAQVGVVSDTNWKTAQQAGWTDTELAELPLHIALNTYTNTFNRWANTELDFPTVPNV
uniref:carboxymuconolactone decarboxylase family protein n=1 Tax=Streptomyces sp. AC627_RSS907 TaxID=2823684 RepID=UPI0027E41F01